MMRPVLSSFVVASALTLTGCIESGTKSLDTLSYGDIQKNLVRGRTTKAQVLERFGKPRVSNIINGQESWIYNRSGINPLFVTVNKFVTLTIMFKGKVVSDYQYSNSKTSTF